MAETKPLAQQMKEALKMYQMERRVEKMLKDNQQYQRRSTDKPR